MCMILVFVAFAISKCVSVRDCMFMNSERHFKRVCMYKCVLCVAERNVVPSTFKYVKWNGRVVYGCIGVEVYECVCTSEKRAHSHIV